MNPMSRIVNLYGYDYDLATFQHPGGRQLIDLLLSSADPTLLFQYYHTPRDVQGHLDPLRITTTESESCTHCTQCTPTDASYRELRQHVAGQIPRQTMARYRDQDRLTHGCTYLLIPWIYYSLLYGSWYSMILAGFVFSIMTLWTLHGNSHGLGWTSLARWSTLWSAVSPFPWAQEHVRIHHVFTRQINADSVCTSDPDIQLVSPFLRLTEQDPWYFWHRVQHLVLYPMVMVVGAILPYLDLLNLFRGLFSTTWKTTTLPILQKLVHLGLCLVLPVYIVPGRTYMGSLVRCSWLWSWAGVMNFFVNLVSHCNTQVSSARQNVHRIIELQTMTTVDIHPGNRLVNLLTAGLSHQVVHHLFPGLPFSSYPEISGILVKFLAMKHARSELSTVEYRTFPTYVHAFWSQYNELYRLGHGPGDLQCVLGH
jgi:fatty acid desaturase